MYRELGAEDHRRMLRLSESELPDALLLVGAFDVANAATRFGTYLEDTQLLGPHFPGYLARRGDVRVALAGVFGGPMAALHAHTWLGAGVPVVVQLGWYGALQHGTQLGDVVVPSHAERQDGVSDWYLGKGILADSTPALSEHIAGHLHAAGVKVERRSIYSTPAILAESRDVIADWSRHGYFGVDMETAATFAVARSMGRYRAAALIRLDDLVAEEDGLDSRMPRERRAFVRACEPIVVDAVLAAVAELKAAGALSGDDGPLAGTEATAAASVSIPADSTT